MADDLLIKFDVFLDLQWRSKKVILASRFAYMLIKLGSHDNAFRLCVSICETGRFDAGEILDKTHILDFNTNYTAYYVMMLPLIICTAHYMNKHGDMERRYKTFENSLEARSANGDRSANAMFRTSLALEHVKFFMFNETSKHDAEDVYEMLERDLTIYLEDFVVKWSNGQQFLKNAYKYYKLRSQCQECSDKFKTSTSGEKVLFAKARSILDKLKLDGAGTKALFNWVGKNLDVRVPGKSKIRSQEGAEFVVDLNLVTGELIDEDIFHDKTEFEAIDFFEEEEEEAMDSDSESSIPGIPSSTSSMSSIGSLDSLDSFDDFDNLFV